jgi:hypothetical protein
MREPAHGSIAKALTARYPSAVSASDLYDRGCGTPGVDFLAGRPNDVDNMVTNPPYSLAQRFVE